jgi:hypothetical protein
VKFITTDLSDLSKIVERTVYILKEQNITISEVCKIVSVYENDPFKIGKYWITYGTLIQMFFQ